jgi:hypothetical protein
MGRRVDDASVVVVMDDDSDDDEVHICEPIVAKQAKPVDIDAASWALIQKLQAEEAEDDHDDSTDVVAEMLAPHNLVSLWKERIKCQRHRQEHRDNVLAWRLHEQEERKAALEGKQKALDEAVAKQVQRDEEGQNLKSCPRYLSKEDVWNSLEPCQLQAVEYVKAKAEAMSEKSLQQIIVRVTRMGFTEYDFRLCLEYIRDDAPIVIHLKEETLSLLVKDTHYRSQFETNASGGHT